MKPFFQLQLNSGGLKKNGFPLTSQTRLLVTYLFRKGEGAQGWGSSAAPIEGRGSADIDLKQKETSGDENGLLTRTSVGMNAKAPPQALGPGND